jgi:hypothetical protein
LIPYAHLLDLNASELALEIRHSFGNRSAEEFYQAWGRDNRDLAGYGTGLVVHDQSMASKYTSDLSKAGPAFSVFLGNLTGVNLDQQIAADVSAVKTVVEDAAGQSYKKMYEDLRGTSELTAAWGDALAGRIVQKFPDKFPGDLSARAVDRRITVSALLQTHAYLSTMATDAVVHSRNADKQAAIDALSNNADAIASALQKSDAAFKQVWVDRAAAVAAYAAGGEAASRQALTDSFVQQLASRAGIPTAPIANQAGATVKVIDDQRGKSFKTIADDDHAAATAMEPIADALVQG